MNKTESLLIRLMEISKKNDDCDLIEAAVIFCEEQDLSDLEFMKKLDTNIIEQLKYSAIKSGKVRKCVAKLEHDVFE